MQSTASIELLLRWRDAGDDAAMEQFLKRYLERLVVLVRRRMSKKLGRRLDADDIAADIRASARRLTTDVRFHFVSSDARG